MLGNQDRVTINLRKIRALFDARRPNHSLPQALYTDPEVFAFDLAAIYGRSWVHKDAIEGVDYRVDDLTDLWTRTNLQDRDLCETNQRGGNSLGYVPGPDNQATERWL